MSAIDQYFKSKEFLEILHLYEDFRSRGSFIYLEADELTNIAEYYHSKDKLKKADEVIEHALRLFPGATAPLVFKARKALLIDLDPELADEIAEEIEDKTDLDYFYIKAEIMIVNGQVDKANDFLVNHIDDLSDEEKEDYYIDLANLFIDYQQDDKCREWLARSGETDADDYKELQGRLALYAGDFKQSERIFADLIDKDPFSYTSWNQLASSQFRNDNIQEALHSSEYAIAINPEDGEAVMTKAGCLFALGNYEKACEYYERYTKLCPNDEYGELLYGITLFNLSRPQEGLRHMKKAERIAQHNSVYLSEIYQQISITESYLGHPKQSIAYLQKAMKLPDVDRNELRVMKGHVELENNMTDAAEKSFQEAMVNSDMSPNILLHIAVSLYDNRRLALAYEILHSLMSSANPELKEGYSYLAMCCYDLKKKNEFLQALKKACQANPSEAKAVLGNLFPDEMEPKDYYNYFINHQE